MAAFTELYSDAWKDSFHGDYAAVVACTAAGDSTPLPPADLLGLGGECCCSCSACGLSVQHDGPNHLGLRLNAGTVPDGAADLERFLGDGGAAIGAAVGVRATLALPLALPVVLALPASPCSSCCPWCPLCPRCSCSCRSCSCRSCPCSFPPASPTLIAEWGGVSMSSGGAVRRRRRAASAPADRLRPGGPGGARARRGQRRKRRRLAEAAAELAAGGALVRALR